MWWRFALAAVVGLFAAVVSAGLAVAAILAAWRSAPFTVFGQRDPDARAPWWTRGGGTHGSGGQVPPYVPYNPDWDPDERIP